MNLELMPPTRTHDVSGFGVFSHGDAGQAHVMAHRMLDEGRHELEVHDALLLSRMRVAFVTT
jgi:hypothetical protein